MSQFDVRGFAASRRYRTRNLNDGQQVPPVLLQWGVGHRNLNSGMQDVDPAIVCRHGYVHAEGDQIGWVLLCPNKRALSTKLAAIRRIPGVLVRQVGDSEAAGTAPPQAVDAVLQVLRPYWKRPAIRGQRLRLGLAA